MNKKLDEITAEEWVQALLAQPVLARIATADLRSGQPHVVPVWFEWDAGCVWISSFNSTRKNRELASNPRAAVVIDVALDAHRNQAVIFEGRAEIIADPQVVVPRSTSIYTRYLGEEGVKRPEPASWIVDPDNRVICLRPEKIYTHRED